MLFNLKEKKRKKTFLDCFIGGFAKAPFDPLTYDGNTIALWDGDDLVPGTWLDQVSGQVMTLFNAPALNLAGLNGHGTVTFNGSTQYAQCLTPVSLPFTQYLVINPISYLGNRYLLDNANDTLNNTLRYSGGSPNFSYINNSSSPGALVFGGFGLNNYKVLSIGVQSGLLNSWWQIGSGLQTNWGAAVMKPINGITLGANNAGIVPGNVGYAFIIIRSGIDNQATADLFINFLKTRFGI